MDPQAALAETFEAHRGRLTAIAARVVGTRADAEDVVQEAWVRLARQQPGAVENVGAWLTTVVGRLCLDVLRSRTARAEVSLGAGAAELIVTEDEPGEGPEDSALAADSVGLALLVVLGTLEPDERLAFVLHDVFSVPFAEIGAILGKSGTAAKMSASRARRKVRGAGAAPARTSRIKQQRGVVDAFLAAARDGDYEALLGILAPDLTWEVHTAAGVNVRVGAHELLRVVARGDPSRIIARRVLINGQPGILAWNTSGQPVSLMSCTVENGRMTKIASIIDRRRLAALSLPPRGFPATPLR